MTIPGLMLEIKGTYPYQTKGESMRNFIILMVIFLMAALAYLAYAHFSGGAIPTFGLAIGGEKAEIRRRSYRFFEQVKFKNANALRDYVSEDVHSEQISEYLNKIIGLNVSEVDLA